MSLLKLLKDVYTDGEGLNSKDGKRDAKQDVRSLANLLRDFSVGNFNPPVFEYVDFKKYLREIFREYELKKIFISTYDFMIVVYRLLEYNSYIDFPDWLNRNIKKSKIDFSKEKIKITRDGDYLIIKKF